MKEYCFMNIFASDMLTEIKLNEVEVFELDETER
jgi:hypothetical protein